MQAQINYHYINIYNEFSPKVEWKKDGTIQIHFPDTKDKSLIASLSRDNAGKLADWINYAIQDYDIAEKEVVNENTERD